MLKTRKLSQYTIIILCWLVYVIAYLGRYSYNSNITLIIDDYGVTKAQAGLVPTLFFFAYGAGQVINGIMSRRYNKKWLFPIALMLSSAINLTVFFNVPFRFIKYLWLLNGFTQSCLWSGIISVISKTIDDKHMNFAVILLSTTTCIGTVITYGASSLFAHINNYKMMFLFSAVIMTVLGIVWFSLYSTKLEVNDVKTVQQEKTAQKKSDIGGLLGLMLMISVFAVIHNIIKDGLTTWMPDILKERYMLGDSVSILLTIALPLIGVFGAMISIRTVNRFKNFISAISLFFAVAAVSIGAIVFAPQMNAVIAVLFFGSAVCMMHGINNISTSVAPLKMRDSIDSGKFAGIMNGCCYLGSTISSYGFGKLADNYGWQTVLNMIFALCIVSVVIGAAYSCVKKRAARS